MSATDPVNTTPGAPSTPPAEAPPTKQELFSNSPAFPATECNTTSKPVNGFNGCVIGPMERKEYSGLTVRDYMAVAVAEKMSFPTGAGSQQDKNLKFAKACYALADAFLIVRNEG